MLVREAIKAEGLQIEVHIVPDGEQAIDFIAHAEQDPEALSPDVALLDLNLPRVDGFEVLRRLRNSKKYENIPVLIVTSSDSAADREQAASLNAGYFRKPVTYGEFLGIGRFLKQFLETSGLF